MGRIKGPRKVHRYSAEFKVKAVKLSQIEADALRWPRSLGAGLRTKHDRFEWRRPGPVSRAASGVAINLLFVTSFQKIASGHFVVRRLERKYGLDVVKSEYEAIAKRSGYHSSAPALQGR